MFRIRPKLPLIDREQIKNFKLYVINTQDLCFNGCILNYLPIFCYIKYFSCTLCGHNNNHFLTVGALLIICVVTYYCSPLYTYSFAQRGVFLEWLLLLPISFKTHCDSSITYHSVFLPCNQQNTWACNNFKLTKCYFLCSHFAKNL